jgi:hypothetical protein
MAPQTSKMRMRKNNNLLLATLLAFVRHDILVER